MKKLLNPIFVPILELVNHLYKHNSEQSITFFSELLELDRRTILKTINTLQKDIISNHWEDMITIEIVDKILLTKIGPLFSIETFYTYYMSKSFCVELALHLFTHQSDSIDELAEHLYVSKATFYRRITPLKEVLSYFDVTLDFISSQNKLVGSEKQIRYFYFNFFWEIFRSFPNSKKLFSESKQNQLITFLSESDFPISFTLIIELQLSIALSRIQQGFIMNDFPDYEFLDLPIIPEFGFSYHDFQVSFSDYFDFPSVAQTEIELHALYFSIITSTIYPPKANQAFSLNQMPWTSPIMTMVQKWILYFTDYFKLNLSNEEYFYLLFNLYILHLKDSILVGGSLSLGFNSVNDVLFKNNRYASAQVDHFFDFLNQKEPMFHVTKFQVFSYTLLIRRIIYKASPTLQILVCSKVSSNEKNWVEEKISSISTVPVQFHLKWNPKLDLIISDFPLPERFMLKKPDTYFIWESFCDFSEWIKLIKRLEEIYFSKAY